MNSKLTILASTAACTRKGTRSSATRGKQWLRKIATAAHYVISFKVGHSASSVVSESVIGSGVTTVPTDPAMHETAAGILGPKLWHYFFFHWKFNTAIFVRTCAATSRMEWLQCRHISLCSGIARGGLGQGCSLGLDVSVSRRSRDAFSQRLGLVSVSVKCGNVSVSVSSRSRASGSRLQVTIFSYKAY